MYRPCVRSLGRWWVIVDKWGGSGRTGRGEQPLTPETRRSGPTGASPRSELPNQADQAHHRGALTKVATHRIISYVGQAAMAGAQTSTQHVHPYQSLPLPSFSPAFLSF